MNNLSKKVIYIIIFVVFIIFGLTFIKVYNNYQEINNLANRLDSLENEIQLAEKENQELKDYLANIEDDEYVEKIAREKLGLVKPGEMLIIPVIEDDNEGE